MSFSQLKHPVYYRHLDRLSAPYIFVIYQFEVIMYLKVWNGVVADARSKILILCSGPKYHLEPENFRENHSRQNSSGMFLLESGK